MYVLAIPLAVALLVALSAICSGLNIALMSLKLADLRRKAKLGNRQATLVLPFRENSHLTLASIILTNVAVISATSLVLGKYFIGLVAGAVSTLLIVVFGEVLPQALFLNRALRLCATFAPLLKIVVFLTYPVSKPLQLLLDKLLGPERTTLQSRGELGLLIGEHAMSNESELDAWELEIMRGALQLSEKRVRDIMTPLKGVYWLTPDMAINDKKIDEIKAEGWSRVPVLNRECTKTYGILLTKDLMVTGFTSRPTTVSELPLHPARMVGSMTALDTLFRLFIGAHSHLMPVEKDGHIIGIATIEDLLEEIIGHEIEDETDQPAR